LSRVTGEFPDLAEGLLGRPGLEQALSNMMSIALQNFSWFDLSDPRALRGTSLTPLQYEPQGY